MSGFDIWQSAHLASARQAWDVSPALIVVTLGPEHRVAYQNPASQRLFGPRAVGADVATAFPEMSEQGRTTLDLVLGGSGAIAEPIPRPGVLGAAGEEVQLTYVFAPLVEPGEPPWGVLLTAIDVTAEVKAQRAALQSELLSDLSEAMNDAADPNDALRVLARTLVPAVADIAAVFVTSLDRDIATGRGASGGPRPRSVPSAMSISANLLETVGMPPQGSSEAQPSPWEASLAAGRSVLIDIAGGDLADQSDDAVRSWLNLARAQNMAVLPLSLAGQLAGAVVLVTAEPRLAYGAADLPFLELVAARAGSAVSHVRAFRQQWQIALDLQTALLPDLPIARPGLDVAARYVAGGSGVEIGGDWWDVHHLGEDHVGVGLGDVSGRGVQAAIVMGHARAAMRAAAMAGLSPAAILTLLDAQLADLMDAPARPGSTAVPPRFATSVYADIDLRTGTARLANAGHPPMIMRTPDGKVDRVHAPPGPPLGVRAANYEEIVVSFPPGAVLVGFTDGLIETRDSSIESGLLQIDDYLRDLETSDVDVIADGLLELMSRSRELQDDIALVVLRHCEPGGS
jgi:Stage II sporulation protein E (SpoIIE)